MKKPTVISRITEVQVQKLLMILERLMDQAHAKLVLRSQSALLSERVPVPPRCEVGFVVGFSPDVYDQAEIEAYAPFKEEAWAVMNQNPGMTTVLNIKSCLRCVLRISVGRNLTEKEEAVMRVNRIAVS